MCYSLCKTIAKYSICHSPVLQSCKSIVSTYFTSQGKNNNIIDPSILVGYCFNRYYLHCDPYLQFISKFVSLEDALVNFIAIPLPALEPELQITLLKVLKYGTLDSEKLSHLIQDALVVEGSHHYHEALLLFMASTTHYQVYMTQPMINYLIIKLFDVDSVLQQSAFKQLSLLKQEINKQDTMTRPWIKEALKPQMAANKQTNAGGIARVIELFPQNPSKVDFSNTLFMVLEKVISTQFGQREMYMLDTVFDALHRCPLEDPLKTLTHMISISALIVTKTNTMISLSWFITKYPQEFATLVIQKIDSITESNVLILLLSPVTKENTKVVELVAQQFNQFKEFINDFHSLKMYNICKLIHLIHRHSIETPDTILVHLKSIGALLKLQQQPTNYLVYYAQMNHLFHAMTPTILKKMILKLPDTTHLLFIDDCADFACIVDQLQHYLFDLVDAEQCNDLLIKFMEATLKHPPQPLLHYFNLFLYPLLSTKDWTLNEKAMASLHFNPSTPFITCWLQLSQILILKNHTVLSQSPLSKQLIKFAFTTCKDEQQPYNRGEASLTCALCITHYDIPLKFTYTMMGNMLKSFHMMECVDVLHSAMDRLCKWFAQRLRTNLGDPPATGELPEHVMVISKCLKEETQPHVIVNIYKVIMNHPLCFLPWLNDLQLLLINPLAKMITLVGIELRTIVIDLFIFLCTHITDYSIGCDHLVTMGIKFMHAIATSTAVKKMQWIELLNAPLQKFIQHGLFIQYDQVVAVLESLTTVATNVPTPTLTSSMQSFVQYVCLIMSKDVLLRQKSWQTSTYTCCTRLLEIVFKNDQIQCYAECELLLHNVLISTQHYSKDGEEAGELMQQHCSQLAYDTSTHHPYKTIILLKCLLEFKKESVEPFIDFTLHFFKQATDPQLGLTSMVLLFKMAPLLIQHRHVLLSYCQSYIEQTKSQQEHLKVFDLVKELTSKQSILPNLQEQVQLLTWSSSVIDPNVFYNHILALYQLFPHSELTRALEPLFMKGMTSVLASKFIKVYNNHLKRDVKARLLYLVSQPCLPGLKMYLVFSTLTDEEWLLYLVKDGFHQLFPQCWSQLSHGDQMEMTKACIGSLARQPITSATTDATNDSMVSILSQLNPPMQLPPWLIYHHCTTPFPLESTSSGLEALQSALLRQKDIDGLQGSLHLLKNKQWTQIVHYLQQHDLSEAQSSIEQMNNKQRLHKDVWIYCAKELQQWELINEVAQQEQWPELLKESEIHVADMNEVPFTTSIDTIKMDCFKQCSQLLNGESTSISGGSTKTVSKYLANTLTPLECRLVLEIKTFDAITTSLSLIKDVTSALDQSMKINQTCTYFRHFYPNRSELSDTVDVYRLRCYCFDQLNKKFSQYIPNLQSMLNNSNSSLAFKGFHELAWSYNQLSRVYRKHNLIELSITTLNKVYTLPNIELQEAFTKLKEQAKCYLLDVDTLPNGLELIKTTNTHYFNNQHKSEFLCYKAKYLEKMSRIEEANDAYMNATQTDKEFYKAWSWWGRFLISTAQDGHAGDNRLQQGVVCLLQALTFDSKVNYKDSVQLMWVLSTNPELELQVTDLNELHFMHCVPELVYLLSTYSSLIKPVLLKCFNKKPEQVFTLFLRQPQHELVKELKGLQPILFQTMDLFYHHISTLTSLESVDNTNLPFKKQPNSMVLTSQLKQIGTGCHHGLTLGGKSVIVECISLTNHQNYTMVSFKRENGSINSIRISNDDVEYPITRTSQGYWDWMDFFCKKSVYMVKRHYSLPIVKITYLLDGIVYREMDNALYSTELVPESMESLFSQNTDAMDTTTTSDKWNEQLQAQYSIQKYFLKKSSPQRFWEDRRKFTREFGILQGSVFALNSDLLQIKDFCLIEGGCKLVGYCFKQTNLCKLHFRMTPAIQQYMGVLGIHGYFKQMLLTSSAAVVDQLMYLKLFLPVQDPEEESKKIQSRFLHLSKQKSDELISMSTNPEVLKKLDEKYLAFY